VSENLTDSENKRFDEICEKNAASHACSRHECQNCFRGDKWVDMDEEDSRDIATEQAIRRVVAVSRGLSANGWTGE